MRQRGFTLIEAVMLIVLLGILSSVFVHLFSKLGNGLQQAQQLQIVHAMIQECHEYLYQARRRYGYAMNSINDCSAVGSYSSYGVAQVQLDTPYAGTACPSGANCKLFHISVPTLAPDYERSLMMVEF